MKLKRERTMRCTAIIVVMGSVVAACSPKVPVPIIQTAKVPVPITQRDSAKVPVPITQRDSAKASVPITQRDSAKVPDAPSTEPVIVTEPPEWIDPPQVTQESKQ
jgi:hypothetical protein